MTDKKEESFEDRFALKVKPDTRMRQVRFFKKEVVSQLPATAQRPDGGIICYVDQEVWTNTST